MNKENKIEKIIRELTSLNLGEVDELITNIKERYHIKEETIVGSVSVKSSEKTVEKSSNVAVKLLETGDKKVLVYNLIKNFIKELKGEEINVIAAKKLTEQEDKIILENIARDKAENIKTSLEEKGAKVEIREI